MPAVDAEPEYVDWDPFWWVEVEKERLEAEKEYFTEVFWTKKVLFLFNLVLWQGHSVKTSKGKT